jgi:hypothetical protein
LAACKEFLFWLIYGRLAPAEFKANRPTRFYLSNNVFAI